MGWRHDPSRDHREWRHRHRDHRRHGPPWRQDGHGKWPKHWALAHGVHRRLVRFVLLGAVVEAASGESLADFAAREVFAPLGMAGACFRATTEPPLAAAPTELDPARGGIVRGHVHDENAFAMGGIAGHAGMFATADDVLRFGTAMLAGGRSVLPRDLVARATRNEPGTVRGLGFRCPRDGTFSHTGFTGTSLWCCPRHDLCVVLLTNRVHPTRVNNKIQAVRTAVHDLVLAALR